MTERPIIEAHLSAAFARALCQLLRRSAELHPGMGHYEELAVYYDTLDDR